MTAAPSPAPSTPGARPAAIRGGRPDSAALARAEAALRALSSEFAGWMAEELRRFEAAGNALHAEDTPSARDALHARAHDLKGLGATYGHPLASRLCASLSRLLDDPAHRASADRALVDAHVEAVRTAVSADPTLATRRCEELEGRVAEALAHRSR